MNSRDKIKLEHKMENSLPELKLPEYKFALVNETKNNKIFLPTRAEPNATGWDVRCAAKQVILKPFDKVLIPLGIRGFCAEGYWYELKPRSSTFSKKHLNCLYGTIDSDFQNQLMMCVSYLPPTPSKIDPTYHFSDYISDNTLTINYGEAIGQIIPVKRQEMIVSEVSNEEYDRLCQERNGVRGEGGFGSSDEGFVKCGAQ